MYVLINENTKYQNIYLYTSIIVIIININLGNIKPKR